MKDCFMTSFVWAGREVVHHCVRFFFFLAMHRPPETDDDSVASDWVIRIVMFFRSKNSASTCFSSCPLEK